MVEEHLWIEIDAGIHAPVILGRPEIYIRPEMYLGAACVSGRV